jgi:hypothetical protein
MRARITIGKRTTFIACWKQTMALSDTSSAVAEGLHCAREHHRSANRSRLAREDKGGMVHLDRIRTFCNAAGR